MLEEQIEQRPEPKKRRKMGTVQNLKSAITARLRSKPLNEGQEYLDMWQLKRDRARWVQAQEQAKERLVDIEDAIAKVKLPEDEASSHEPNVRLAARTADFTDTINFGARAGQRART